VEETRTLETRTLDGEWAGTPLDPSRMSREYLKPALREAGITKPIRPFHDLTPPSPTKPPPATRWHTCNTKPATRKAPSPNAIHAAQVLFPGDAARGEAHLFAAREIN
jgi:hypothetical protein